MNIIEIIDKIMESRARRSQAARQARLDRISAEVADQNEGLAPTQGRDGRMHAPCDGYFYQDNEREGTYMAGEFLPIPINDDDEAPADRVGNQYRQTMRIERVCYRRARLLESDWLEGSYCGEVYDLHGTDGCHFYLRGPVLRSDEAVKLIIDYLKEPIAMAEKALEEERAREYANAEEVPEGRLEVSGEILALKTQDGYFGPEHKMLIKDKRGFKLWGTRPSSLYGVERGDHVSFMATAERSSDDPKFGFYKRPTKAVALEAEA